MRPGDVYEDDHKKVIPGVYNQPMHASVLVLGANGFIGREVVAAAAATGRLTPILGIRRPLPRNSPFEQRVVEATDIQSVSNALRGVTAVVDCVAGGAETIVSSAKALFGAVRRTDASIRVMHLSTMSVYGSSTGLISEAAPLRADLGPYGTAKIEAEKLAVAHGHTVVFRPGCVFGPGSKQWSVRIARLLLARRLGDLGAAGDGGCNLVHVRDVAAAIVRALERPDADGQAFNLSTPDPPTWNEFFTRFAQALRAVPVKRIGPRQLRLETKAFAPPLKIAEIIGGRLRINERLLPPPISPALLRLFGQDIRLDTTRVETVLDQSWRDLNTSLRETADWYNAEAR